jgi:hypothetical protein
LFFHLRETFGESVDLFDEKGVSGDFVGIARGFGKKRVLHFGLEDVLADVGFDSLDLRDALGVEIIGEEKHEREDTKRDKEHEDIFAEIKISFHDLWFSIFSLLTPFCFFRGEEVDDRSREPEGRDEAVE